MRRPLVTLTLFGGFAGTIAFTLILYYLPLIGWPRVDYAEMIAHTMSGTWDLGLFAEVVLGVVVFPLILTYYLWLVLPGPAIVKGVTWGLALWLIAQVVFMPVMGWGFFSSKLMMAPLAVVGAFVAHLVWGAAVGAATSDWFYAASPGVDPARMDTRDLPKAS